MPTNDCVVATGSTDRDGYAYVKRNGKRVRAHRFAWTLANGPIPDGLFVLHKCDNPPCINLDHLFLGTQQDNVADRVAKGRTGYRPVAKLTRDQVEALRFSSRGETKSLAREFGISQPYASRIRRGLRARRDLYVTN